MTTAETLRAAHRIEAALANRPSPMGLADLARAIELSLSQARRLVADMHDSGCYPSLRTWPEAPTRYSRRLDFWGP